MPLNLEVSADPSSFLRMPPNIVGDSAREAQGSVSPPYEAALASVKCSLQVFGGHVCRVKHGKMDSFPILLEPEV